jgi:hypothetical protein
MQKPDPKSDIEISIDAAWVGRHGNVNGAMLIRLEQLVHALHSCGFNGTIQLELVVVHSTNDLQPVQDFKRTGKVEIRNGQLVCFDHSE